MGYSGYAQEEVNWLDFNQLEIAMEQEERLVFIDFYTSWCGWCKKMDRTTYKDEAVVKALNKYFYAVHFDAEYKGDVVFQNTSFGYVPSGRRGYHQLAVGFMQEKMTFPTLVVLSQEYHIMQAIQGYQSAKDLLPILEFIGSRRYREQSWEAFMQSWNKD